MSHAFNNHYRWENQTTLSFDHHEFIYASQIFTFND